MLFAIFDLLIPHYFLLSFESILLWVQDMKLKTDFQMVAILDFHKEDNFSENLFAFLLELTPLQKGSKNNFHRVVSLEGISFPQRKSTFYSICHQRKTI